MKFKRVKSKDFNLTFPFTRGLSETLSASRFTSKVLSELTKFPLRFETLSLLLFKEIIPLEILSLLSCDTPIILASKLTLLYSIWSILPL